VRARHVAGLRAGHCPSFDSLALNLLSADLLKFLAGGLRGLRDHLVDLVEFLPNIGIEVKTRKDTEAASSLNEWHGGGEIPAAARFERACPAGTTTPPGTNEWMRLAHRDHLSPKPCRAGKNHFVDLGGSTASREAQHRRHQGRAEALLQDRREGGRGHPGQEDHPEPAQRQ
jgi:hypothetical protein